MGVFYLLFFGGKKGRVAVVVIAVAVGISDYTASSLIKPFVARIRPCNMLEGVNLLVSCTKAYSFPSSHASNIFALSTVLVYRYRRLLIPMAFITVLVCLSRVYLGLHYPSDVIAGGVCGVLYGSIVIFTYNQVKRKYEKT